MEVFGEIFSNKILVTALWAWFIAQVLKVIIVLICEKRFDFTRFVGAGGMPSSHAAFVTSISTAIGIEEGFTSPVFALCFVVACVVMYDAAGVRRAAGQQAKLLNKLVERWDSEDDVTREKRLKELLGHTPFEVIAGALLGIVIAILLHHSWA